MNTTFKSNEEISSRQIPRFIQVLLENLGSKDGMTRVKARKQLVRIGPEVIDFLAELVYSSHQILRWEAVKTLGEIADPQALPLLLDALEDQDSEVRWLAAKGLARLGSAALVPLLETLLDRWKSAIFREGVHRVLYDFRKNNSIKWGQIEELLAALSNDESKEEVPIVAKGILNILKAHE